MTIVLTPLLYMDFVERAKEHGGINIRAVKPIGSNYEVTYDHSYIVDKPTETTSVPTVLGSVSPQGGQGGSGESLCQGDKGNRLTNAVERPEPAKGNRAVEKERGAVHTPRSIISSSKTMARYLDTDCPYNGDIESSGQADSERGIPADIGSHEEPSEQLRRTPDVDTKGQAGLPAVTEPKERATDDVRVAQIACPTCEAPLDADGTCSICKALSGLFEVCERNRRNYHLMKSGLREESNL